MKTDGFHYLKSIQNFIASNENEAYPLAPWLGSLGDSELDTLVETARDTYSITPDQLSDVLGIIGTICFHETKSEQLSYTEEKMLEMIFAIAANGAVEQLRRAGAVRLHSPMILTSGNMPSVELIRA